MSTTIVGLYDEYNTAEQVVDRLKDSDVHDRNIHVNAHDDDHTSSEYDTDGLHQQLTEDGVPADEARLYAEGVQRGGTLVVVEAEDGHAETAAEIMNERRPVNIEDRRESWMERGYTGENRSRERFSQEEVEQEREHERTRAARQAVGEEATEAQLKEAKEELRVGKREVPAGKVRLHKRVKEKPVEETVHLHQEEVDVEERAASGTPDEDVFEEETIEMREKREEPVVEKETKVTGEVVAKKRERDEKETVRDTVRETEVDVEEADTEAEAFERYRDIYQRHHSENIDDGQYKEYEPAYRFGHRYGTRGDNRDRKWSEARPQIRKEYEAQHGEGTFEDVKEAVRYGYRQPRRQRTT